MGDSRKTKRLTPPTRRRLWLVVGGVLAWVFGGPTGFLAACVFVLLLRIWRVKRNRRD